MSTHTATFSANPVCAEPIGSVPNARAAGPFPAVVAAAVVVALAGAAYLRAIGNWRLSALFLVGVSAGVVLYHASFGFTSAWRVFVSKRRGAGVRAQMLMLALACSLFIPILAMHGPVLGMTLRGSVAPVGVATLVGAFLFGVGMQLGGSCASGTLYTSGGGNTRMLVVLASFIAGSLIGTQHAPFWDQTPSFRAVSLSETFGPAGAIVASVGVCAFIAFVSVHLERARHGHVVSIAARPSNESSWLFGPWVLAWGAVGLVCVNLATLLLAGRPWGVTSAFALWGAKAARRAGVGVASWPYWSVPARAQSLNAPVMSDITTVMDLGIMLGAMAAAGLAGKFRPGWRVPPKSAAAAVSGGLLLGYGARLASGCNIGWVWFVAAFAGTTVGTRLRPWFGLSVER